MPQGRRLYGVNVLHDFVELRAQPLVALDVEARLQQGSKSLVKLLLGLFQVSHAKVVHAARIERVRLLNQFVRSIWAGSDFLGDNHCGGFEGKDLSRRGRCRSARGRGSLFRRRAAIEPHRRAKKTDQPSLCQNSILRDPEYSGGLPASRTDRKLQLDSTYPKIAGSTRKWAMVPWVGWRCG
jgi:hypothetical protein